MSEEKQEYPGDIAMRNFNKFRTELGVRSNNEHVGSGLGGNPTEFWFILNHTVKVYVDNNIRFVDSKPNEITAYIPGTKDTSVRDIRKAFSEFVKDHPDKVELTDDTVRNVSYLRDVGAKHPNAEAYIRGLEKAYELSSWLDTKIEFQKQYHTLFGKEIKFLETQYLKEVGLPEDYFEVSRKKHEEARKNKEIDYNDQNRGEDPNGTMFKEHPIWGAKRKAVQAREKIFEDNLLSQEDKDRMQFIGALPGFVCIQVVRSIIGIERIVALNLDECWDALAKINKVVDGK